MSSLLTALQSIPDHRSARGKRYPLWVLLVFIVMGNLAGYRGNRPLAEFAQRYGRELTRLLQVELKEMPCFAEVLSPGFTYDLTELGRSLETMPSAPGCKPLVSSALKSTMPLMASGFVRPIAGAEAQKYRLL
jgi:hypothetical protein